MENQLRWKWVPDEQERKQIWYLVIINSDKRELNRIYQKALKQLSMIEEDSTKRIGKTSGICYIIAKIVTEKTKEVVDLNAIFGAKKVEDRDLYEREKTGFDGLEAYVQTGIEENRF